VPTGKPAYPPNLDFLAYRLFQWDAHWTQVPHGNRSKQQDRYRLDIDHLLDEERTMIPNLSLIWITVSLPNVALEEIRDKELVSRSPRARKGLIESAA